MDWSFAVLLIAIALSALSLVMDKLSAADQKRRNR